MSWLAVFGRASFLRPGDGTVWDLFASHWIPTADPPTWRVVSIGADRDARLSLLSFWLFPSQHLNTQHFTLPFGEGRRVAHHRKGGERRSGV